MTPPNIDLSKVCPELAEGIAEIEKVEKYFTPGVEPKAIQNTEIRFTFFEAKTIAATMLKLAEFAEYCLDQCSWDNEPDGGDIQDKAEELGFLELRPIDPEDSIDGETEHYFCKWTPKASRKGDPA